MKHIEIKHVVFMLAIAVITIACKRDNDSEPKTRTIALTEKSAKIIEADNQFGLEIFKKIDAATEGQKNTMISPTSIAMALGMAYNGANGETKTQFENVLHKQGMSPDDINRSYSDLSAALSSHDPKVALEISNAIFYRDKLNVKSTFVAANKNYYKAEVSALNFNNATETLKKVNDWVNTKTKGKIDKILEKVNPNDAMYVLNAVYFNGEWKYRFDPKLTDEILFVKDNKTTVKVPAMTNECSYGYFANSELSMLEMLYGSGKYSMLVILPSPEKSVDDVVKSLNAKDLINWIGQLSPQKIKVFLPKFEYKFDRSLVDVLCALGLTDAFSEEANFKGISDIDLQISDILHKTYIKADERGTEAAAVTKITFEYKSIGPGVANRFIVNRPFVFAIREKDTNALLFIGKVVNPIQK